MTDLATWTCALCGFTTDQPTTVDKVWHKCRQKRWRLHALTRRDDSEEAA